MLRPEETRPDGASYFEAADYIRSQGDNTPEPPDYDDLSDLTWRPLDHLTDEQFETYLDGLCRRNPSM